MNKQSNTYTILYSAIMVIVVGAVLALISGALKPKQNENIRIEKMKQMLSAVHISPDNDDMVIEAYNKYFTEAFCVNNAGEVIGNDADAAFAIDLAKELKKDAAERVLPVFKFTGDDSQVRYLMPVSGAGLWGPIWGYVAVEADGVAIYGAYFSHQGETPGLGAEIEKPAFQDQFQGKELYKAGQKPTSGADYVDAISGGTITSKGVQDMLKVCLTDYSAFLNTLSNENSK